MKKFLLGVLAGFIVAGVTAVVLIFAAVRFTKTEPKIPAKAWLSLKLQGEMPEVAAPEAPFPGLSGQSPLTVADVWRILDTAATDPAIKGVMLEPRGLAAGWGKMEEIRAGIRKVRRAGKPVHAWLASPGTREYLVASAAEKVALSPEDLLDVKGLRLEAMYFKGALDKLGVQFEVEHIGKYKDAADPFSRSSMTPETRESLNSILDELYSRLCTLIGESRKMTPSQVVALLDEGPFLAPKARDKGLVDALQYEKDAVAALAKAAGLSPEDKVDARDYLAARRGSRRKAARFAVLAAQGDILRGSVGGVFGEDQTITPAGISRQIRAISNNPRVRGVVLRVDSPGGDAIASDEILADLKQLAAKKPLVISMSDVAASGGYYISMTGDPVVAYPGTITGSIGVVYGKANLEGFYNKLGISTEILKRGRFADIDSGSRPLTPEAREKLRESLRFIYDGFLKRVGEGRRKAAAEIEPVAQGRVWMGAQAKANGLIDETGTLDTAIALLRKKAKLEGPDVQIDLDIYPRQKSWFELLMARELEASAPPEVSSLLRTLGPGVAPWLEGGMLRVMPFQLRFR
ncbi:MAG: signal peptide peptidase SppA [Bryobacteraceae bacterium]|nr:signal peptide peptidase SppA [Bryobacteraceae bacterium]